MAFRLGLSNTSQILQDSRFSLIQSYKVKTWIPVSYCRRGKTPRKINQKKAPEQTDPVEVNLHVTICSDVIHQLMGFFGGKTSKIVKWSFYQQVSKTVGSSLFYRCIVVSDHWMIPTCRHVSKYSPMTLSCCIAQRYNAIVLCPVTTNTVLTGWPLLKSGKIKK